MSVYEEVVFFKALAYDFILLFATIFNSIQLLSTVLFYFYSILLFATIPYIQFNCLYQQFYLFYFISSSRTIIIVPEPGITRSKKPIQVVSFDFGMDIYIILRAFCRTVGMYSDMVKG